MTTSDSKPTFLNEWTQLAATLPESYEPREVSRLRHIVDEFIVKRIFNDIEQNKPTSFEASALNGSGNFPSYIKNVREKIRANPYAAYYFGVFRPPEEESEDFDKKIYPPEEIARLMYPDPNHPYHIEYNLFMRARANMYITLPPGETPPSNMQYVRVVAPTDSANQTGARVSVLYDDENISKIYDFIESPPQTEMHWKFAPEEIFNIWRRSPVAFMCGEAGTGKTYQIVSLIRHLQSHRDKIDIYIAAPTNLAAENVRNKLPDDFPADRAMTTHRFVGPRTRIDKTKFNIIIVDETSMLGGNLLLKIFEKLSYYRQWRVLLTGDWRQLRPVNNSPVFRILLDKYKDLTFSLLKNYRSDDLIIKNARRCLARADDIMSEQDKITNIAMLAEFDIGSNFQIQPSILDIPPADLQSNSLVITYRNRDAARLATLLHDKINPSTTAFKKNGKLWKTGDRILCAINDTVRDIYNNSQCKIIEFLDDDNVLVDYQGRRVPLNYNEFINGHVITIHKSQGQEADLIIIYLPHDEEGYERDLIYTAITRAKKRVIMIIDSPH